MYYLQKKKSLKKTFQIKNIRKNKIAELMGHPVFVMRQRNRTFLKIFSLCHFKYKSNNL